MYACEQKKVIRVFERSEKKLFVLMAKYNIFTETKNLKKKNFF